MILEPLRGGWVLLADPLEVLPMDDLLQHCSGLTCPCRPELNDDDMIEHNSFDRREDYVTGKRKVS